MSIANIIATLPFAAILLAAPLSAEETGAEAPMAGTQGVSQSIVSIEGRAERQGGIANMIGESDLKTEQSRPPPVLVTRNSIVSMEYAFGQLMIRTEGRAMSQGRAGELVRIMNLNSKSIVAATVIGPSKVVVK